MTLLYPCRMAALAIWACVTLLWLVSLRLQDASLGKPLKRIEPEYEDYIASASAFIPWSPRE